MNAPEKPPRLGSAEIASALRRDITGGVLLRHDRLPAERMLADQFGVSRGTIREALTRLNREGLVEIRPGSGAYVSFAQDAPLDSPIDGARPLELIDARFAVEPHICRLAVLHSRRSDFEILESLMEIMERSVGDPTVFAQADSEFHATLAKSTGNTLLIWMVTQMGSVRTQSEWTRMSHLTLNRQIIVTYNAQHRAILEAIRSREPESAAQAMKQHLETARLSLTRAAAT